jgi:hypothetical protein
MFTAILEECDSSILFDLEDGDIMFLQNVGRHLPLYPKSTYHIQEGKSHFEVII